MIVIPGRIPIAIHPFFWLFAALMGFFISETIPGTLMWVVIIFVSVLFHEFGHALTALCFRQKPQIQLIALGGVTSYDGPKLKFFQQFLIVFNGPFAGFMLFLITRALLPLAPPGILATILSWASIANLFWSIVNLLPVLPLDGGQLLKIVLEGFFGLKGFKASLLIGAIIALLISLVFFLFPGGWIGGALFFLFAFQSFDLWRKNRKATPSDREESLKKALIHAEELLAKGDKSGAAQLLREIREKAGNGLLSANAGELLAFLAVDRGNRDEAYQILLPIREELAPDALLLLQELAAERDNPSLVASLAVECYQIASNRDVAIRNARAFAALKAPEPAGGWLQTAWQHGSFDLRTQLADRAFDAVRNDPLFRRFVDVLE
jgi:Zn-dependent protease